MTWGSYDPEPIPLSRPSEVIGVFRLNVDSKQGEGEEPDEFKWFLEPLPNVLCERVTIRKGEYWPTAEFRYSFDPVHGADTWPSRFHHVYGNVRPGPNVVQIDDRLVVIRALDDGDYMYMFDGFVVNPQANAGGNSDSVTFVANGTPSREWDFTLPGAMWANEAPLKEEDLTKPAFTEVQARFNPLGRPNAAVSDQKWKGKYYFTDVDVRAFTSVQPDNLYNLYDFDEEDYEARDIVKWTVGEAAKYCVALGIEWPLGFNPDERCYRPTWMQDFGPYVSVYDIASWNELFKSIVPALDGKPVNLDDPNTYEKHDIACPDVEVTGEAWPIALARLIQPYGFDFRFDLRVSSSDGPTDGMPEWILTCYRTDDARLKTKVYLQDVGDLYDPSKTNVGGIQIQRDAVHVANEIEVDTGLTEYEGTFLLIPAFPITAGDDANLEQWMTETQDKDKRHYYRKFVFGEGGSLVNTYESQVGGSRTELKQFDPDKAINPKMAGLKPLFKLLADKDEDPVFVRRNREPIGQLGTKYPDGRRYIARLDVSTITDAKQNPGELYDPSLNGKWQRVAATQWKTLEDEIGIELTGKDPSEFHAGPPRDGDTVVFDQQGDGILNLVSWLVSGYRKTIEDTSVTNIPIFALTCLIHGDHDLDATASRRASSITKFRIRRRMDKRTLWKRTVISKYSRIANEISTNFKDPDDDDKDLGYRDARNDTASAKDAAVAYQRAHEAGTHAGVFLIKRISTAYNVGQSVTGIVGRDVDLKINTGAPDDETPLYPYIQSISWTFQDAQQTQITLSDERAEPISKRVMLQLRP